VKLPGWFAPFPAGQRFITKGRLLKRSNAMNLREVERHTQADILAGNAVIWKGPPGFGKTDKVLSLFNWYRNSMPGKKVGFSLFFMATQSEIGFTGLPWKGERQYGDTNADGTPKTTTITDPAVPQWYLAVDPDTGERKPAHMFDSVFLVLEEWGQGSLETKRAGAEVLRAGGCGQWYLPPGSPRLALTNVDARDGVTKEFDFIIGRRAEYEISGDVNVWLEDFADKPYQWQGQQWSILPVTKVWARGNQEVLFEAKPEKQGPWCNPRTLTMADRYTQVISGMSPNGEIPVNDGAFVASIAGKIGYAAAQSFIGHMQFALQLPKYEDIVYDPEGTPIPGKADLQLLMAYTLAGRTTPADTASVIKYMSRKEMPKDMSITFVSSLFRRDAKSFIGEPAMKAWISKNASLISVIQSLAA
jgi:hypothetical protein